MEEHIFQMKMLKIILLVLFYIFLSYGDDSHQNEIQKTTEKRKIHSYRLYIYFLKIYS